jgi:hypothetical protein
MESNTQTNPQTMAALEPSKTATTPAKERTTFLALPHELRQQILLQTHDLEFSIPNVSNRNLLAHPAQWKGYQNTESLWVTNLKAVDEAIVGDVEYVAEKWAKERKSLQRNAMMVVLDGVKKRTKIWENWENRWTIR